MAAPKTKLSNGFDIPVLGLGTATFYYTYNETKMFPHLPQNDVNCEQTTLAVKQAIDAGYRHFDSAYFYRNEAAIGKGILEKIQEGAITREDVFVTSKICNTSRTEDVVVPMCKKSLANFGLDYIDLYLIHWPVACKQGEEMSPTDENGKIILSDVDYLETWKGMEECVKLGLTRSIGLSNFNHEQIARVLTVATIKPVVNQVECTPYLNQKKLIEYCKKNDIVVTAYSPLGRPDLFIQKFKDVKPAIEDERVLKMAKTYNKTAAQVILRYLVDIGTVPIPKSVTKSRIIENITIFDFKLSDDDMKIMNSLNNNLRIYPFDEAIGHKFYPFSLEY